MTNRSVDHSELDHALKRLFVVFGKNPKPDVVLRASGSISEEEVRRFSEIDWETADAAEYDQTSEVVSLLPSEMYLHLVPHWFRILRDDLVSGDETGHVYIFSFNSGYSDGDTIAPLFETSRELRIAVADVLDALQRSFFFPSSLGEPSELSKRLRQ